MPSCLHHLLDVLVLEVLEPLAADHQSALADSRLVSDQELAMELDVALEMKMMALELDELVEELLEVCHSSASDTPNLLLH